MVCQESEGGVEEEEKSEENKKKYSMFSEL